jgi:hypothetical protein
MLLPKSCGSPIYGTKRGLRAGGGRTIRLRIRINHDRRTLHARRDDALRARRDLYMSTAPRKVARPKTVLDLEPHDCRWPIGEPRHPDFHFCGRPRAPGRPYCDHHWSMAFQPPRPRQQRPALQPPTAIPPPAARAA